MSGDLILEAKNLELRFGGVQAASGASLQVRANERIAIIGPNGAGKTTFINLCTGYIKPQSGSVVFAGEDVTALSSRAIARRGIGRSFQIPQLFADNTVIDNLLLSLSAREGTWSPFRRLDRHPKREEMWALLDSIGLKETGHRPVRELPEGMRKLIDIAVALALEPKLIFMDEPTSGVSAMRSSRSWIRCRGRSTPVRPPPSSSSTIWMWSRATPAALRSGRAGVSPWKGRPTRS
jgi:branched-chain amino acid transport system ATP-binding protein